MDVRGICRQLLLWSLIVAGTGTRALAQSEQHHHEPAPPAPAAWTWTWGANVFVGWNYQVREFTDFDAVESQNWFMGGGEHPLLGGRFRAHSMISLEPFTVQALGSPQVFQTGETYQQVPLIDYQHPHDLFMDLGTDWTRDTRAGRVFVVVAAVGPPAIGPPAFMHRLSAEDNPAAPLSHHQLDATHITHGLVTGGFTHSALTFEGSWFRGAEPDEDRTDIEMGKLDSYSGRVTWQHGGWSVQASGAHLTRPEYVEPFSDMTRLTASIMYSDAAGRLDTTLAWGENREIHGILDAYLAEGRWRPRDRQTWYARAELSTKDILGASGRHPPGFVHFHPLSRVGAFTVGHIFDLTTWPTGRVGIGGDVTGYYVPDNLRESYGSPVSFHVFVRLRGGSMASHAHHQ